MGVWVGVRERERAGAYTVRERERRERRKDKKTHTPNQNPSPMGRGGMMDSRSIDPLPVSIIPKSPTAQRIRIRIDQTPTKSDATHLGDAGVVEERAVEGAELVDVRLLQVAVLLDELLEALERALVYFFEEGEGMGKVRECVSRGGGGGKVGFSSVVDGWVGGF